MTRPDAPTSSATDPDWSREVPRGWWDPSRRLLRSIRRYQAARTRGGPLARLAAKYWVLSHRFWTVMTGAEIHLNTRIGGGLLIPHPNGIVINATAQIGPNCLIFQQVTIGDLNVIGGGVDIGAGARIVGPLTIGDHAIVGANAVVTRDVPPGHVATGIPARSRPRNGAPG